MRKRILILPISAALIVGVCWWKLSRDYESPTAASSTSQQLRAAPLFELYDQSQPSKRVRLFSFIGRHRVLVVFFDADQPVDQIPLLLRLREQYTEINADGTIVLAISTALPQENRKAIARSGKCPYPLLSDPGLDVHRTWGCLDAEKKQPLAGVFLVDRAGRVNWSKSRNAPEPVDHPGEAIASLVSR